MRISDWSSDVCSSDLPLIERVREWTVHVDLLEHREGHRIVLMTEGGDLIRSSRLLMKELIAGKAKHRETAGRIVRIKLLQTPIRSEEHTSELQSLMRISYAVFCLKKKTLQKRRQTSTNKIKN